MGAIEHDGESRGEPVSEQLQEVRCAKCRNKIGMLSGRLETVCDRCKRYVAVDTRRSNIATGA